ncbi:transglycosylase family protein [Streptomyces sp. AC563]|uniref:transglycosylase family protein n=1 Tax=Streptomyces buecherae TaxID=2763006 RepID=UPI00164EC024|nr:transglycosylase family protein [Streptomyces buecherae]MBC3992672.1 transglycosylase family protein [Streptomyces buecherae]
MRSGNGKHRRPRQAPAIVVAAGVTGAGIALPLLGATSAGAADTATWDRVAECESGGTWSANDGNGRYGGLGLSLDAWQLYGGTDHAPRPDLASRAQQIAIAQTILSERGPMAWNDCAQPAGLTEDGEVPDVNPGDPSHDDRGTDRGDYGHAPSPEPDRTPDAKPSPDDAKPTPTDERGPDAEPTPDTTPGQDEESRQGGRPGPDASAPSDDAQPTEAPRTTPGPSRDEERPADRDEAGRERPDASRGGAERPGVGEKAREDGTGTGKHRGEPDGAPGRPDGRDDDRQRPEGRHADRGERGRVSDRADQETRSEHRVRSGDTLWAIAEQHETPGGWPALYEANESVIGGDPDLILPGQKLDLEAAADR